MKVELVTKSVGVGIYDGMSAGKIIESVARHGKIKEYGKLIKFLVDHKHWSPMEHMHYTFRIETSRAISAQLFRHKSLHFQELSQRYDVIQEVEPIELREQAVTNRQSSTDVFDPEIELSINDQTKVPASWAIEKALDEIQNLYTSLLEAGVAKECARMILPMGSKTVIHITGNIRDLFAFLNVRCDSHAQKEAQDIALAMGEYLEKEMPEVLSNLNWREGMFM
jgi:thymidylate synthase (FAD)|tara:strand:- start:1000 stop:1671 length:672 start_codon:yes stop_codon:yes gene_type:complete